VSSVGSSRCVSVPAVLIRPFRAEDTDALYEVCLRTGDNGSDATAMYDDPRLLGHVHVGPYLALEPELAFVLADDSGAIGYVLGALETRAFERRCEQSWWPTLRTRYPDPSFRAGWAGPDQATPDEQSAYQIHHRWSVEAEIVDEYPSHLHIDLLPPGQGQGYGRRMIDTLLAALVGRGSSGVHLGVRLANRRAIGFYRRLGFEDVYRRPTAIVLGRRLI
jgi:ribosomal protein S18 acetylase RimI-like enzyme